MPKPQTIFRALILVFLMSGVFCFPFAYAQTPDLADEYWKKGQEFEDNDDFINAAIWFEKSADAEEKSKTPRKSEWYHALNNAAYYYLRAGENEKSFELRKKCLPLGLEYFGREHHFYASDLAFMGYAFELKENYDSAIYFYTQTLEFIEDAEEYDERKNTIFGLYSKMGRMDLAIAFELNYLFKEKIENEENDEYVATLNHDARVAEQEGRFNDAIDFLNQIEDFLGYAQVSNKNETMYELYFNLFRLYLIKNDVDRSIAYWKEAFEWYFEMHDEDEEKAAILCNNTGDIFRQYGKYEEALGFLNVAMELLDKSKTEDKDGYIAVYNNMGMTYQDMGDYEMALEYYQKVTDLAFQEYGVNSMEYAENMNNIGSVQLRLGQYDKAIESFKMAVGIVEKNQLETDDYGIFINGLAQAYQLSGDAQKASNYYLSALMVIEKVFGKYHRHYANIVSNIASLFVEVGDYQRALPYMLDAVELTEKTEGKTNTTYALRMSNLGFIYHRIGQYQLAINNYLEAIKLIESLLGKNHPDYLNRIHLLAQAYDIKGENDKVLPLVLEAKDLMFNLLDKNFHFLSEKEKEQYVISFNEKFQYYLSFLSRESILKPELAGIAYDIELARKGMILQSSVALRQHIFQSGDEKATSLFEELVHTKNMMYQEYLKPIHQRSLDLRQLERKAEELESQLGKLSKNFNSSKKMGMTTWQQVQQNLKRGEVAIEFSHFNYNTSSQMTDSISFIALVLHPTAKYPQLIQLCNQQDITKLFSHHSGNDEATVASIYRGAEVEYEEETIDLKSLYILVWKPIDPFLKDANRLYFSVSGDLHRVAFAAIPVHDTTFLMDQYQLIQVSSSAKLLETQQNLVKNKHITLIGGVDYMHGQDFEQGSNAIKAAWSYLPGTKREVNGISELAKKTNWNYSLLQGFEASESVVKQIPQGKPTDILHIATHGFFYNNEQEIAEPLAFKTSENPLMRSGLILAGGNNSWAGLTPKSGAEDGILTAFEVAQMNLTNTPLVVLSACETGLGDIKGSEGVFGLQRAFKSAGVQYLLMSLWKVPDAETVEFMHHFYQSYFEGKPITEAFHYAQNIMRNKHPNDPYKWAAFVLVR